MRRRVAAAAVVLLLGGCGDDQPEAFEPASSRPCDFLTYRERDEYALEARRDEADLCVYDKKVMAHDSLTGVTVQYRTGTPESLAAEFKVTPVTGKEAEETTITFKGSAETDYRKGTCVLLAPLGDDRTLVLSVGIDTSGIHWVSKEPVEEPCAFVADESGYPEILAKLRS